MMPTIAMKNVRRPSAARVTSENVLGRAMAIIVMALPAMSRMANTASNGLPPKSQKPPE